MAGGANIGIIPREEIPFERLCYDAATDLNEEDEVEHFIVESGWEGRICRFGHVLEAAARTIIEMALLIFKGVGETYFKKSFATPCSKHFVVLKDQWSGLKRSCMALIDPIKIINNSLDQGVSGCPEKEWSWGTPYQGTRTFSGLSLLRTHYSPIMPQVDDEDAVEFA